MRLSISNLRPAVDRVLQRVQIVCDSHSCHSRQIIRSFPGGRRGIQFGKRWYCSVDCFVDSVRTTLFALSNRHVLEIPRNPRLSLGLVMLSKGYLTPEQLRTAADQSQWLGESLEATLVHLGIATEKEITVARSAQWGYPVLAQEFIGHMVQADIPQSILQSCSAAPLHYSRAARRILLGFVFRVEHSILKSIEQMTGCRVEPCFITATDFAEQNERLTKISSYREIFIEDPGSPDKMARTLGRAAVDLRAHEVEFTQCKSHIWVRLKGRDEVADVVFRLKDAISGASFSQSDLFIETTGTLG